ncbi:ATP-dependent RNA helicase dbp10, partial [Arthroderma sp. PD_2]
PASNAQDGNESNTFQNPEYFMSYTPTSISLTEDRGYGVHTGSNTNTNFVEASRSATMDLNGDEGARGLGGASSIKRWDKRHKKYVLRQNDEDGSKGEKLVRGESGAKIAASFRSGRFDSWKKGKRLGRMPRVGEMENSNLGSTGGIPGRKYRHNKDQAPKAADKYRGDYDKMRKKGEAMQQRREASGLPAYGGKKNVKSKHMENVTVATGPQGFHVGQL